MCQIKPKTWLGLPLAATVAQPKVAHRAYCCKVSSKALAVDYGIAEAMHKALFKRMLKADVLPLAHLHSVPFPYYTRT